jgi:glyoxylase-like metal-dependent hydrolase (beta-lactamase superfamily II)
MNGGTMVIKEFVVGPLENNCFIIVDDGVKECFITDPGDEPDRLMDYVSENSLRVKYLVCTHAHFDHVGALPELQKETGAKIIMHKADLPIYERSHEHAVMWGFEIAPLPQPDIFVSDGDKITVGNLNFEILHTPGHSPGGICVYGEGIVVTGDTLFAGSVGRTDLPGGDIMQLRSSFRRLMTLSDGVRVLPGHGPETTIGHERSFNFFASEL